MNVQKVLIFAAGILFGFIAGFALANGINRSEQDKLRGELTKLRAGSGDASQSVSQPTPGVEGSLPTLTDEQLAAAVARADANPEDANLQRISGQALYLYATEKGNTSVLPDAARLLERALASDPGNNQLMVLAANAHFIIARNEGDAKRLREARRLYEKAIAGGSEDVVVRTSLGMTYFYDAPPDPRRAVEEYRRALEIGPRHELPLQASVLALSEMGEFDEAERHLKELESVNPSNAELPNLRAQLMQKRNASKEKQ